jgi:hypothetical protein
MSLVEHWMQMTAAASRYSINAPDVVAEDFDGKIVILNLADGRYFSLEGIASQIWSLLLAGRSPEAILGSIESQQPSLSQRSSEFVDRLIEWELVRPQEAETGNAEAAIDEVWSDEEPRIEVFDDLAELILADPIHDVDEQVGWPSPRPVP